MNDVIADDRLDILEARHRMLHAAVNELAKRVYLTPDEQRIFSDLKKLKLLAKDELFALRRQSSASSC